MAEELRPMHEVVLEELESSWGNRYRSLEDKVEFAVTVWRIFKRSKVPEEHLGEVIERLKKLREATEEGSLIQRHFEVFIRDLEARQAEAHQLELVTTEGEHQ